MKLFVTDYDGTLFTTEEELNKNISMLKKLSKVGFMIVISTGRSLPSIKEQIDTRDIPYDYLSCGDGSILYDKNNNIVTMYVMNKDLLSPFQNFYEKLDYVKIQFSYPDGYYNYYRDDNNLLGVNVCLNSSNYNDEVVKEFLKLKEKYPKYNFLNYRHPDFAYLCIKPKGINKASMIDYLVKEHNINKEDVYVIGDSYNDHEMIEEYLGACMETSCEELLQIVNKRYASVTDYIKNILKED